MNNILSLKKVNYIEEVNTDLLKIIACILMLVDHLGFILNNNIYLRALGRLGFPLFVYLLVLGNNRTSNKKKYLFRLLMFALISQIPYMLLFNILRLNVFFSLSLGLMLINIKFDDLKKTLLIQFIFIMLAAAINFILPFDYGIYGLFLFFIFYWFRDKKLNLIMFVMITFLYCFTINCYLQMLSIIALLIIYYIPGVEEKFGKELRFNKYIYYIFYPGHIYLLFLIKTYCKQ